MVTFQEIQPYLDDIKRRRSEIKDSYIRAWFASSLKDDQFAADWIIQNVEIVEVIENSGKVRWYLQFKKGGI